MNEINQDTSVTWQASNYSKFWAKTLEYGYKHRLGTQIPTKSQRPIFNDPMPTKESYDFRNEPYMQQNRKDYIRDQGECGASWAFSTVDVATDRVAKLFEGKRGNESASVEMVIACAILPGNANGCTPASIDIAWKFIESTNKDFDGKIVGG